MRRDRPGDAADGRSCSRRIGPVSCTRVFYRPHRSVFCRVLTITCIIDILVIRCVADWEKSSEGFDEYLPCRPSKTMAPGTDDKLIAELTSHSSRLAALLPQVQASVSARLQAVEAREVQAEKREKTLSSREKELAAQERALAERERKLVAAVKDSERKSDKADKKEAVAKEKEKQATTGPRKLPAPPAMVDIPMEALARATAAALLKVSG